MLTGDGARDETVEFVVRPSFVEERPRQNDYAETASRQALVDLSSQAVSNLKFELVEPDFEPELAKSVGNRPNHTPLASSTFASLSLRTICSALCRFFAIPTSLPRPRA